ncbi:hypothetical protein EDC01DRAFT_630358 [Geopyxis carbonaria]|nr:hypothetical protein EDC01DRAFT_630358 [Geopyxis carbonaria]
MSKSTISVFLPIFFAALVICAIVLCTCAFCGRPSFFSYLRGSNESIYDEEKGPEAQVVSIEHETVGSIDMPEATYVHHPSSNPDVEDIDIVDAQPPSAENIEVVDAHPDLD